MHTALFDVINSQQYFKAKTFSLKTESTQTPVRFLITKAETESSQRNKLKKAAKKRNEIVLWKS